MSRPQSAPTRSLPERPNFAQLQKQAKELLKAFRAGQPGAVAEIGQFERDPDPANLALADAQRVLARAYGFSSWTKLKQHVDGVSVAAFCRAADSGDVATVRRLAKARPKLVEMELGDDFGEQIALHLAVLNRDADMTAALMELGSDAQRGIWPHRDATTAYTIAQERGYDEIVAIIDRVQERRRRQLSSQGATISSKTNEIQKAIIEGRTDDAIQILESDLTLVGACNNQGATPLHMAAWTHNATMVAWLIDRKAPVDARAAMNGQSHVDQPTNASGYTPLDFAAIVAGWSAHGRDFCFLENSRVEPARFYETVRLLRSQGAQWTPRAAVAVGDVAAVRQMHDEGRLRNEIHFLRGGLLSIAVRVNRVDMVSLLLDLGLDPDESAASLDGAHSWGMPLWFTAMCGRDEIARLLLSRGADVNAIVHACGDPLSIAGATQDQKMVALLLERGARITVEHVAGDKDRVSARAILEGTMPAQSLNVREPSHTDLAEQMLWAAGSSDPEIVRMCLSHVQRTRDDPWWNYVLMHATLPESFELVLKHGVDPDVAAGGYTILHHLATVVAHEHPRNRQITEQQRLSLASMLLDAGASLDRRDPLLKSTPLGWACRWGGVELARLYLDRGADAVEPRADPWATPLAWATKGGHREIAELLRSRGAH